jgi:hypothetical protein
MMTQEKTPWKDPDWFLQPLVDYFIWKDPTKAVNCKLRGLSR